MSNEVEYFKRKVTLLKNILFTLFIFNILPFISSLFFHTYLAFNYNYINNVSHFQIYHEAIVVEDDNHHVYLLERDFIIWNEMELHDISCSHDVIVDRNN